MSHESRHSNLLRVLLLATLVAASFVASTGPRVRAQTAEPSAYPVMSAARAWAFVQAAERKLDYVPGEVLVKFKPGVRAAGQQRALMALRSRPAVGDLR